MFQPLKFGRYILTRKLAMGGMAEIFLAKFHGAEGFEKELVVKKILPQWSSDRDFIAMLIDEAKIAVQLNHPNIIQVLELARVDDTYYIAMDYVDGVDLRRVMQKAAGQKKRVPLDVVLTIMTEVLDGLSYAHSRKDAQGHPLLIVHRDISPQNILVSYDGTAKVTDFGIARAASRSHETTMGVLKGKIAYMSPEQANQGELDARTDLFSAAVVMYELLTGERLFYRDSDIDTLDRVRRGEVVFSEKSERLIPQKLREILLKALARDPQERFQEAASFRDELQAFARRTKKTLKRDAVGGFLSLLFAEEIQDQVHVKSEETKILSQARALLMEETKTIAPKEVFVQRDETQLLNEDEATTLLPDTDKIPRTSPLGGSPFRQKYKSKWPSVIGLLTFVLLSLFVLIKNKMLQKPAPVPEKTQTQAQALVTPPVKAPETEASLKEARAISAIPSPQPSPVKQEREPPLKGDSPKGDSPRGASPRGYLSVQAIPWGYVTIDGGSQRWETPVSRLPLAVGSHTVEIEYEPEDKKISAKISMETDGKVVCLANFREGKEVRCN